MNVFQTSDVITADAVAELIANVQSSFYFNRGIENNFTSAPAKGTSVRIRYVPAGEASDLFTDVNGVITSSSETYKEFRITEQPYQYREIKAWEKTLSVDDFTQQVIRPMTTAIAKKMDKLAMTEVDNCVYAYPAATPVFNVGTILDNNEVEDERVAIVTPEVYNAIASELTPVNESGDSNALRRGEVGMLDNTLFVKSTRFSGATFTTGDAATGAVNGAVAVGATSVVLDSIDVETGTIKAGDTLIITDASTGRVQHVKVSADATITTNAATVVVNEQIKYAIANDSAVVVYDGGGNTHKTVGVMFARNAFGLASIAPDEIEAAASSSMAFEGFGLNMSVQGSAQDMKEGIMLSSLFGVKLVDEVQAVKMVVRV
jgi:hypothetical protein